LLSKIVNLGWPNTAKPTHITCGITWKEDNDCISRGLGTHGEQVRGIY
jgi:hypothetical protein